MRETDVLHFVPFRVELAAEQLWKGEQAVRLTAKAFAVLRYLVAHAGQLVTHEALFDNIWGTPYVTEAALAACIREIRRALEDNAWTPQFLETVRGRGYRSHAWAVAQGTTSGIVGREAEFAQLQQWWGQASQGDRFLVTLVDALVQQSVLRNGATGWELAGGLEPVTAEVPESVRQLIDQQLEQLSPEDQEMLEAASVVGRECATAAITTAVPPYGRGVKSGPRSPGRPLATQNHG